jgi:hypothetical protein
MKRNKTYLVPLNIVREPNTNLVMLRAVLDQQYTRLDFGYIATDYFVKGGWIRISPETFLSVHGSEKRFKLTHADNIPIAPDHHHFESTKDWQYFSLYFEPIPQKSLYFDLIEVENPDENDFNYYGIELDLNTAEEIISEKF